MKDEIKEILDDLRTYKDRYEYFLFNNLSFSDRDYKAKILLDYITNLQEEKDKYKNVIDKIKEYCNKQIEIAKENITNSEQWLKVEECHLSAKQDIHTGKLIKKENEKILELLEEVE